MTEPTPLQKAVEPWSKETMSLINKLTSDIKGKAFDPDWFLLRQRLEQFDEREAFIRLQESLMQDKDKQLSAITDLLPPTYYSDRPTLERLDLLIKHWQKVVSSVEALQTQFNLKHQELGTCLHNLEEALLKVETLKGENEGLKASNAEHRRVKEFGFLEMMDENTTLILDRDSLNSALESMTKERDDLFKKIERLVGATGQDNLTGVCNLIESTRNENAKLLEMFKSISCECRIYEGVTVVCTRCEAISTTTPPTNADNSKEGK